MARTRGAALLVVLSLAIAACGGGAEGPAGQGPVSTDRVEIFDSPDTPQSEWGYEPREIQVPAGTTVTFVNTGDEFHTVTEDTARVFDIAARAGETVTYTFGEPGRFPYHCGVHPEMKGVIHVCDGDC